ncbi:MAG: ABC transporter ATP-binding protein [Pseudomonadota bacterium]
MTLPPVLEVRDLSVRHLRRSSLFARASYLLALDAVSFALARGEALAIVGESGSGKSTLVRSLFRLHKPQSGQVLVEGVDLAILSPSELRERRRSMQMVFQDPLASLDPTMTVEQVVAEPLQAQRDAPEKTAAHERVVQQLIAVGLDPALMKRRSQRLSGGQAQRVAIARALIGNPAVLICDEPVSALDASLRAQILDLLVQLRRTRGLSLLFITHDLSAARYVCENTLVLHRGQVVERGTTQEVLTRPQHAFTRQLLESTLTVDPVLARQRRAGLIGDVAAR